MMFNPGQSWLKPRKPPQMGIASGAGSSAPGALAGPRPQGLASSGPRYGLSGLNMGGNVAGPSGGTGLHNLIPQAPAPSVQPMPSALPDGGLGSGAVSATAGAGAGGGLMGMAQPSEGLGSGKIMGSSAGAGGGLMGMVGENHDAAPAGGFNALTDWQGQISDQRNTIDAIHNRVNRFADPHAMDVQKRGLESRAASQMAHAERDARNMAFAGPMVTQQDLDNLNSTGRAALLQGLAGIDLQRQQAADNWGRQNYQDEQAARTQYGQMLRDYYGLTDANRASYEAADTYGIRRAALDAQMQAGQAGARQQQNENALAPLRQAQAEAEVAAAVSRGQITAEDARQAKWMADNQGWVAAANFIAGITDGAVKIATMGAL